MGVLDDNDHVELQVNLSPELPEGTRGVVVMMYPGAGNDYEVEFADADGCTIALQTINGAALTRVTTQPI